MHQYREAPGHIYDKTSLMRIPYHRCARVFRGVDACVKASDKTSIILPINHKELYMCHALTLQKIIVQAQKQATLRESKCERDPSPVTPSPGSPSGEDPSPGTPWIVRTLPLGLPPAKREVKIRVIHNVRPKPEPTKPSESILPQMKGRPCSCRIGPWSVGAWPRLAWCVFVSRGEHGLRCHCVGCRDP